MADAGSRANIGSSTFRRFSRRWPNIMFIGRITSGDEMKQRIGLAELLAAMRLRLT